MSKFKTAKEAGKLFEYFFDRLLKGFRKDQGRDPENLEMILIRQEAGNKAKEADKVIEVQFGKSFGEEVDDLIKSGDVKIGQVTKKNNNVLQREMFQNSFLNKPTIEGQMEKITGASNRIDEIMKEQADMYKPKSDAEIKAKFDKQNKESIERLKKKKEDDPGFYTGGITDVEPSLDDIGHGSDSLMSRTRLMSPGSQATTSTGLNYLLAEDNDNIRVPFAGGGSDRMMSDAEKEERAYNLMRDAMDKEKFLKRRREEMEMDKKRLEEKRYGIAVAEGGRIGFANGNGVADEDAEKAALGKRVRELMDDGFDFGEAVKQAMSEGYAEGGRIGFAKGKIAKEVLDKGRRGFMKAAGAAGAGIAALKTGLLGFGEKAAPVAKEVIETVSETAQGVPPYFLKLVEKIKDFGTDVTKTIAYKDKQKVTKYKDYELTEDLTTGEQTIQRMKVLDEGEADYYGTPLVEETYMSYRPGKGQMDETMKGKTPPDDYEEGTAYLRTDKEFSGDVVDEMSGISDDIFKEVGEEVPEAIRKTKADGGRIGFSSGKLATLLAGKKITSSSGRFLEKIFGRGSLNEISKRDPEMHRGLLEVVEMFRNRDNAGLIEYMQNFLPHMSKKEIQAFIKGDAVDAAGQGKYGLGDMQGQLIRLGSGRDYKGKLEAMKKLDNAQKLDTLDVTEEMIRKPNASGGIQTMLGE